MLDNIKKQTFSSEDQLALDQGLVLGEYGNEVMKLHWKAENERRGIGKGVSMANHIAITVSDVGASASFYSHVLGLQQIERPNFDRHGAWFTLGNVELHLIKGMPRVADGDDLIVSHIALESDDVDTIVDKLRKMEPAVDFQINVSVPTANEKDIVDQIFLRDPDGYYVEIGNSTVLTKFVLGHDLYDSYSRSCQEKKQCPFKLKFVVKLIILCQRAKKRMQNYGALRQYKYGQDSFDSNNVVVNEVFFKSLMKRTKNYADITQKQNESTMRDLLKKHNNYCPDVILDVTIDAEENGQVYQPPTYFDEGRKHMPNPGQWFMMPRGEKKPLQAKYFKVGDHQMRIQGSIKNLEIQNQRIDTIFKGVCDRDDIKNESGLSKKIKQLQDQVNKHAKQQELNLQKLSDLISFQTSSQKVSCGNSLSQNLSESAETQPHSPSDMFDSDSSKEETKLKLNIKSKIISKTKKTFTKMKLRRPANLLADC